MIFNVEVMFYFNIYWAIIKTLFEELEEYICVQGKIIFNGTVSIWKTRKDVTNSAVAQTYTDGDRSS